jgi:hypothetical protein
MANPNSFANYTAQSLFQRRNVLFIGTSMEDVNVRRWLYNSFEERRRHRAQLLKSRYGDYPGAEAEAHAVSIRHFWFKRAKDLPEPRRVIQDSVADAMRHLGVDVMWTRNMARSRITCGRYRVLQNGRERRIRISSRT